MAENDGLKLHPKKTHDLTPCSDPFLTNDESFFTYFAEVPQRFLAGCRAGFSQTGKERRMLPDATLRSEMARKEKGERGLRASLQPPPFSPIDTESFPLLMIHGHIVRIIEFAKVSRPKRIEREGGGEYFSRSDRLYTYVRGKERGCGEERIKYG